MGLVATSLGSIASIGLTACNKKQPTVESDIKYRLNFNDSNLGKDATGSKYGDAKVVGINKVVDGKIHDNNALKFNQSRHNQNYISVPTDTLTNISESTVSIWFKLPEDYGDVTNNAPILSFECEDGSYIYLSPFDKDTWNSFAIHTLENGQDKNLTKVDLDTKAAGKAPTFGTMQSTFGTWQHLAISFSSANMIVYHNGHKLLTYDGNYSFGDKKLKNILIGTSSFTDSSVGDFKGWIGDFRIYHKVLDAQKINSEYELSYKDFLTANYSVIDNKFVDTVRNKTATLKGATLIDENVVNLLPGQSCYVLLPNDSLIGHNELTISSDVYVRSANKYVRLFEVGSAKAGRYISTYLGFTSEEAHKLRYEFVPNKEVTEAQREYIMNEHSTYLTNQWMNVTLSIKNGLAVLYLNGYPVTKEVMTYNAGTLYNFADNDFHFSLGQTNMFNDDSLDGKIKNFKIYSRALNAFEVANENNLITTKDDKEAVTKAAESFNEPIYRGENQILLDSVLIDGVRIQVTPIDTQLIDENGFVYYQSQPTECTLKVVFSRNNTTLEKTIKLNLRAAKTGEFKFNNVDLTEATYETGSRYANDMIYNFEDMFALDPDRLLYSYRSYAGLDTKGAKQLGGWIRKDCGGQGQFESQYIGTLARLSRSMPNQTASTESSYKTATARCVYMLDELKKCQDTFDGTDNEGFLNAFPHECFEALANGKTSGKAEPTTCDIWVPYYMYHKNLMMCYDVYTYLQAADPLQQAAVAQTKSNAYTMLKKGCLWVYNHIKDLTDKQKNYILGVEYGGISEVLYLAYDLVKNKEPDDVTSQYKILYSARFFEESDLLSFMYANNNMLQGRHVNTQIPKILAACAAYQTTGDEFYLTASKNFFDICVNHMSYADGGLSNDEHFEKPDTVTQNYWSNETCCCYNMMRLANYLYKFTGDVKYAQYFEKVFYNHIMGSINLLHGASASTNWNAGKLYSTSTAYGFHKVFSDNRPTDEGSTPDDGAFWCCACSGQETFAKLTYGNYYLGTGDKTNDLYINMYNPSTFANSAGTIEVSMSGDLTEYAQNIVTLKVTKAPSAIHLIVPWWCDKTNISITKDGTPVTTSYENGYLIINEPSTGDYTITFKKSFNFVDQLGSEQVTVETTTYESAAVYYGPTMYVGNLGYIEPELKWFKAYNQYRPDPYDEKMKAIGKENDIVDQHIRVTCSKETFKDNVSASTEDNYSFTIAVKYHNPDKGSTLTFTPFSIITKERFSMYMFWHFNNI